MVSEANYLVAYTIFIILLILLLVFFIHRMHDSGPIFQLLQTYAKALDRKEDESTTTVPVTLPPHRKAEEMSVGKLLERKVANHEPSIVDGSKKKP